MMVTKHKGNAVRKVSIIFGILAIIACFANVGIAADAYEQLEWIDTQYSYFKDKLTLSNGKFRNTTPVWALASRKRITTGLTLIRIKANSNEIGYQDNAYSTSPAPSAGNYGVLVASEVLQVISKSSLLLKQDDHIYYCHGTKTDGLTDGAYISRLPVIVTGTKTYATAIGGTNTVLSIRPITRNTIPKKTFIKAFRNNGQLTKWVSQNTNQGKTYIRKVVTWPFDEKPELPDLTETKEAQMDPSSFPSRACDKARKMTFTELKRQERKTRKKYRRATSTYENLRKTNHSKKADHFQSKAKSLKVGLTVLRHYLSKAAEKQQNTATKTATKTP